jgi:uracil-DNA glycosylase
MERKPPNLEASWLDRLRGEFDEPYMHELRAFLVDEKKQHAVFPPGADIFAAFDRTPFDAVRVVVLGQDPYHGPGQAHGLCFSVRRGVPPPPSLRNIFKELATDCAVARPEHGDLTSWADQGVLLLNTVLTVRSGVAGSHHGRGWERFTDRVIEELDRGRRGLVFLLWGTPAGRKAARVDRARHHVLTAPHPSPLSADRGFFGCRHFSRCNELLGAAGHPPIDWSLPK